MNNIIPMQGKLTFGDMFADGKIKQIKWGDTFQAWPADRKLKYAMSLASAMNEAADKMQQDRNKVYAAMVLAQAQKEEAEQSMAIAKQTMVTSILDSNAKTQGLEQEIMKLRDRIKAQDLVIEKNS